MNNTSGFTFIELLVSVALLSFVLLGVHGVLHTGQVIVNKDIALLDVEQQTRNAIDRIIREVRQASSQIITADYNGTTNDKIYFTIPTATGIQYYLNGTTLVREYPSGTLQNIASDINYLKFDLTGSLLLIEVRAQKTIMGATIIFPLKENVRLRNE